MIRKFKDLWKDWWPFLSGMPLAIYAFAAYLSDAKNDVFLFARLFRWELLLFFVLLLALWVIHLVTGAGSILRPVNMWQAAIPGLKDLARGNGTKLDRTSSSVLVAALLVFVGAVAHYSFSSYTFLHARYHHLDRQTLVAKASKLETTQDLLQAITAYKDVLEKFPYNRFNANLEYKIKELEKRHSRWNASSALNREFDRRWPEGMASTRFDQLLESCRYITNDYPCTRILDYLSPVGKVASRAAMPGATCRGVISNTPRNLWWMFLDPLDQTWLGLREPTAQQMCDALGLISGGGLINYLDKRWYASSLSEIASYDPEVWLPVLPPELHPSPSTYE